MASVLSEPYFHDEAAAFEALERIVWPNGTVTRLANPAADTWHAVEPAP